MDLNPNLLVQMSVLQKNMRGARVGLIFGAVIACQHCESRVINHHTFDQNPANLYCFL